MSTESPRSYSRVAAHSLLLLIVTGVLLHFCFPSVAQQPVFGQFKVPQESNSGVYLPLNRTDSRGITRARKLIAQGEFSQAIRFLDEILTRDEDSFVEGPSQAKPGNTGAGKTNSGKEFSGLKESVRQILKELPPEGRRIYETTFGPTARRLLRQVTAGNTQQLRQIAHRYFYTPAGYEAALMFAQFEADQGRHLTAALTYQELLETEAAVVRFQPQLSVLAAASWLAVGNRPQAVEALGLLENSQYRAVELAGQSYPLQGSDNDRIDWFLATVGSPLIREDLAEQQWLMPGGNPARNGQSDGGLPHLRERWQSRLLEHENLESIHDEFVMRWAQKKQAALPAATPLAVGDYIITRSAHGLVAFDFKTGKRVWQAQPQNTELFQTLIDGAEEADQQSKNIESARLFSHRIWEDYLYNTTSSDGQRVYAIRDLKLPEMNRYGRGGFGGFGIPFGESQQQATNRLHAYDLPTQGKLIWEVDGETISGPLEGAFFLGAPVAVGQSLYCLVEISSETAIYLVALDRKTGALQWRQQLADLEVGVMLNYERRLQASMPSYDQGMLICPTSAGVVVAVDLAKQGLAWAYRYPTVKSPVRNNRLIHTQTGQSVQRWTHSTPVIVKGRVLLTPPDSNELHCLDLVTGDLLWKHARKKSLFLACVEQEHVLLVGERQLLALKLADGKPAWTPGEYKFPTEISPTGSGFYSQGRYYLPLSNAHVIGVDVATGKLAAEIESRSNKTLGNLICYRGAVLSQSGRYLDCFEQVDVLRADSERQLATDPNDFEALRTLGEIAFNEGNNDLAIDLLSQAFSSEPKDLRTREVLGEALVDALDDDFAKYQERLPLLGELLQGAGESEFTLMRLQAKGLQKIGEVEAAFAVCLKAYEELKADEGELLIGRVRKVNVRRWLAAQVAASWAVASSDQRERMTESFLPLLKKTTELASTTLWQQFYDCFGTLESTESLGLELATLYLDQGESLAAQQLFLDLEKSTDLEIRRAAIASSSRLLHLSGQPLLAADYDRQLRGPLADEICLFGQTGLECLAEWTAAEKSVWPYGKVKTSVQNKTTSVGVPKNSRFPHTGITLEQSDGILGSCNVTLVGRVSSVQDRTITLRDSLGHEFFRVKMDKGKQARMHVQAGIFGVSRGNLLILSLGHQIVAFDTLSSTGSSMGSSMGSSTGDNAGGSMGRILWSKKTTSSLQYTGQRIAQWQREGRKPVLRSQSNDHWMGLLGPVTRDSCLFQIDQRLVCVNSLTGEIKWSRDDVPPGCELFGDEEVVFAVPQDAQEALVFSTVDGRSVGETAPVLPKSSERLATVGRQVICWRRGGNRRWELSAIDAWTEEVLWKFDFERNVKIDIVQNRFAVVAEMKGHCTIVDLQNGKKLVDQPISKNGVMNEVHLLAGTDSFVLAVQQPPKIVKNRNVNGFNRTDFSTRAFAGQVYLFDRNTGKSLWASPAEVQGLPLMLAQPVDLPMISFAGIINQRDQRGPQSKVGVMLLEKSSGRMLFHREDLPPSPNFCFLRASKHKASRAIVELNTCEVQVNFTDQPRPPAPPAQQQAQRKNGGRSRGLQKIGQKILENEGFNSNNR